MEEAERQWINQILQVTSNIQNRYNELYFLEIKKDSNGYNAILSQLNFWISQEHLLYRNCSLTLQTLMMIIEIMMENINQAYCDIEAIITQHDDDLVFRRILVKLNNIILLRNAISEDNYHSKMGIADNLQPMMIVKPSRQFQNMFDVELQAERDYYISFLCVLNDYLEKQPDFIIKVKYQLTFLNGDVEEVMLENHFELPEFFVSQADWLVYLYDMNEADFQKVKRVAGVDEIEHQIGCLLEFGDKDYPTIEKEAILRNAIIRISAMLLDNKTLSEIRYSFQMVVDSPEYIAMHDEDAISASMILDDFRSRKHDLLYKKPIEKTK